MDDLSQILALTPQEQVNFEKEQNLYSIVKTIEYLEWAYMTGKIKGNVYDAEFRSLLHHFNMCQQSILQFEGVDQFFKRYNLDHCQTAKQRIKEQKSSHKGEETDKNTAIRVMDITSKFVGTQDLLELGMIDVDTVQPSLSDLLTALNSYPNLPKNSDAVMKVKKWLDIVEAK